MLTPSVLSHRSLTSLLPQVLGARGLAASKLPRCLAFATEDTLAFCCEPVCQVSHLPHAAHGLVPTYMRRSLTVEEARRLAKQNMKDIIACGFDPAMTFIFSDIDHMGGGGSEGSAFYCNALRIMRRVAGSVPSVVRG